MSLQNFIKNPNIGFRLLAMCFQIVNNITSIFVKNNTNTIFHLNKKLILFVFVIYCLILCFLVYDRIIKEDNEQTRDTYFMYMLENYHLFGIVIITGYMSYMYYVYEYKYKEMYKNDKFIFNYRIQYLLLLMQIIISFYFYVDVNILSNKLLEKSFVHSINVILTIVNMSYLMKMYVMFDKMAS